MARFVFRLDPLLRLRRRAEEDAKVALGKAMAREERAREALARLEGELEESFADQRRSREGEIWIEGQLLSMGWNSARKAEIAAQKERIQEESKKVFEARTALTEARRGVQILEKLRERRLEQWKLAERRREQATLSDIAAQRWMRAHHEGP